MTSPLFGGWRVDPALPVFVPERRDPGMSYLALRCACGGEVFRLAGWPRLALEGGGGFFWRTLRRIWREAREPMHAGEPVASPFLLPLVLECDRCGRKAMLFEALEIGSGIPQVHRSMPREAYRCRACRRGLVEIVIGVAAEHPAAVDAETRAAAEAGARDGMADEWASVAAVEVVTRCHDCHREARVAWADARPSEQQRQLDLLYGRR